MRVIVVGNEKGGAGKSTIATHLAVALLHEGAKVAVLDLDLRQQSTANFFANRARWCAANGAVLPHPLRLDSAWRRRRPSTPRWPPAPTRTLWSSTRRAPTLNRRAWRTAARTSSSPR